MQFPNPQNAKHQQGVEVREASGVTAPEQVVDCGTGHSAGGAGREAEGERVELGALSARFCWEPTTCLKNKVS